MVVSNKMMDLCIMKNIMIINHILIPLILVHSNRQTRNSHNIKDNQITKANNRLIWNHPNLNQTLALQLDLKATTNSKLHPLYKVMIQKTIMISIEHTWNLLRKSMMNRVITYLSQMRSWRKFSITSSFYL